MGKPNCGATSRPTNHFAGSTQYSSRSREDEGLGSELRLVARNGCRNRKDGENLSGVPKGTENFYESPFETLVLAGFAVEESAHRLFRAIHGANGIGRG